MGKSNFQRQRGNTPSVQLEVKSATCVELLVVKYVWRRKSHCGRIYKACENVKCLKPMLLYCNIHQKLLCGKYLNLSVIYY